MQNNTILEGYTKYYIKPVSLGGMTEITNKMQYNICKIYKTGGTGTGFLCNLPYNSIKIPFLITNNHILKEEDIGINKTITISFNIEKKEKIKNILINKSRITLTNEDLDFTLIEIKKNDNINLKYIFEIEENININEESLRNKFVHESIYSLHYPNGDNIVASFGLIKNINEKKIQHCCWTEEGSSGAPIITLKDHKVVGIHYGFKQYLNDATFIKSVILELSKYKNENILQGDNNQLFQLNVDYNLLNNNIIANYINNVNEQKERVIEDENSQSIIPFPEEKCDCFNILFEDSSNLVTVIIIPPYKDISKLFDIYIRYRKVKEISKDGIMFLYNGSIININQNMKISEVFQNNSNVIVV